MIILHNRKQLRFQMIYAVILLGLSLASYLSDSTARISIFNAMIGLVLLGNYFLCRYKPYGTIDSGVIEKGIFSKKRINLKDITKVKMFADGIHIYSNETRIVFDKSKIDKSVLNDVETYFRNWILQNGS